MSVSKLQQDLNCKIISDYSHYDFQDWNSGKIIGCVETKTKFYHLDAPLLLQPTAHTIFGFTIKDFDT